MVLEGHNVIELSAPSSSVDLRWLNIKLGLSWEKRENARMLTRKKNGTLKSKKRFHEGVRARIGM